MTPDQIANLVEAWNPPVYGLSWHPTVAEVEAVRRLMAFLEDRRVLYNPTEVELRDHCIESVFEMRREIRSVLMDAASTPELAVHLRAMRASCVRFIESCGADGDTDRYRPRDFDRRSGLDDWVLNQALGELRGGVGNHLGCLAVMYGLDVPAPLSQVLPPSVLLDSDT